jgi:DNA-binding response OmpR family regulator
MRVLIIEDEIKIARNIAKVLDEEYHWAVDFATDGQDGRHLALTNPYDLVILDLGLPTVDGTEILKDLRKKGKSTPVLILTARDDTAAIIRGLELGSDDYVVKPFDMKVLMARCQALVRRSYGRVNPILKIGTLNIDTVKHQVTIKTKPLHLSAMEYRLLEYLAMRTEEVVSKSDIEEHLYSFNSEQFSNVVEVYISSLRKKLASVSNNDFIHTLRNQGYVLGEPPK